MCNLIRSLHIVKGMTLEYAAIPRPAGTAFDTKSSTSWSKNCKDPIFLKRMVKPPMMSPMPYIPRLAMIRYIPSVKSIMGSRPHTTKAIPDRHAMMQPCTTSALSNPPSWNHSRGNRDCSFR